MALINFKLKHPDNIIPWGNYPYTTMHWFGLTDSEYWLDLNKATLYEYTNEALLHWNIKDFNCVDYHLVRLIEDWASVFESIVEPIPDDLYTISKNYKSLHEFYKTTQNWLGNLSEDPAIDIDTYYDKYDKTIEWMYSRTLSAMHLSYGPDISFFRNRNNLSIVWKADHFIEEKIPVWSSQTGEIEMKYETFINEMEDFGTRFFHAMDIQVQIAVEKDWGTTDLNKDRLIEEHRERKAEFKKGLSILKGEPTKHTDWDLITLLIKEMYS